jgi:hypothetical protein
LDTSGTLDALGAAAAGFEKGIDSETEPALAMPDLD